MKIDKSIREQVQAELTQRGSPEPIPEPTDPEWDGFRERLRAAHPDLYEQLLLGLRYGQFPDPQAQQQRQARARQGKAQRKAALTQELDELTGQVVTSRPKLMLWGGLILLSFAGLVAWGVSVSMPQRQAKQPTAEAVVSAPAKLEPSPPSVPTAKPVPKPLPTTPAVKPPKPLPEPAPENWTPPAPPAPTPPRHIPTNPQPIQVSQPEPLTQTQYVPPPPPPTVTLERTAYTPPPPPKPMSVFKAAPPASAPAATEGFSLFDPEETPAESTASPSSPDSFYLASNSTTVPAAPVAVGQFYQGQLASDLILTEGGRMTAVVVSGNSVWQGEASLGASKRVELRFGQLSVGRRSYPLGAVGYGLENNRRVPGLSAQFRDEAPALAADALRGALRGVSRYVDLANQGGSTVVSGGVVVSQPSAPNLLNNVAGSLAELLAVPAGERALVRIAVVAQGTPVQLLVQSLGEPSR